MKRVLKSRILLAIITAIICITGTAYAATQILASDISYKDATVDQALDELYIAASKEKVANQVATLTTQGATYTMQNDGYITGTIYSSGSAGGGIIYYNEVDESHRVFLAPSNESASIAFNVNIFAKKGTNVITRSGYGTYNLTVYEWK